MLAVLRDLLLQSSVVSKTANYLNEILILVSLVHRKEEISKDIEVVFWTLDDSKDFVCSELSFQ